MRNLIVWREPFTAFVDGVIDEFFLDDVLEKFLPKTDVIEKENEYLIKVDVPGFSEKNLKVEVKNQNLIISGTVEKEYSEENSEKRWIIKERKYSSFRREFLLPDNADIEHIDAKLENGVLNIVITKKEEDKAKEIVVK